MFHGNIRPENIYLTQTGEVRLNHPEYELQAPQIVFVPEPLLSPRAILNDVFSLCVTLALVILVLEKESFLEADKIHL